MSERPVNPEKVFFNYHGQVPPITMERVPAVVPVESQASHPKMITDTTLRDGAQEGRFALFPNEAKVAYFDLLHKLDNGTGLIDTLEVFLYQKRDVWVLERLLERGYDFPRVTTWTRATPKDIKMMMDITQGRVKETGMLASASDHHIFDKLGYRSKEEAIEKYLAPIITACENDITPRIHLEDATKADIYGWLIPFMQRVLKETEGRAKFRVCDTLGIGHPDPYVALPMGIPRLISALAEETGAEMEIHTHNDFGMATAVTMAALEYGCKRANVAFAGLGERTGNASLEQVLLNYIRVYGDPGFNLEAVGEMAQLIDQAVVHLPAKLPVIGDVFTTQAGIHQSGVARSENAEGGHIYLPYEPELVGNPTAGTYSRIGGLSGMDGIVAILNAEAEKAQDDRRFNTASRVAKHIYDAVQEAYDGRWSEADGKYVDFRTAFFEPAELYKMAIQYGEARGVAGS